MGGDRHSVLHYNIGKPASLNRSRQSNKGTFRGGGGGNENGLAGGTKVGRGAGRGSEMGRSAAQAEQMLARIRPAAQAACAGRSRTPSELGAAARRRPGRALRAAGPSAGAATKGGTGPVLPSCRPSRRRTIVPMAQRWPDHARAPRPAGPAQAPGGLCRRPPLGRASGRGRGPGPGPAQPAQ